MIDDFLLTIFLEQRRTDAQDVQKAQKFQAWSLYC